MSLTISLDACAVQSPENLTCHLMPCKINHNGKCNVANYFTPYIRVKDEVLSCSMRGHPLLGQKIEVPVGYKGVVVSENKKTAMSEEQRDFKLVGSFKEFTFWNWDKCPSDEDKIVKALQWMDVASAIHKPVSEYEDLEKESFKTGVKRKQSDS
ncbi:ribonuclease H2 subunit C isoform X1 [Parasteatoda tepidariorum]|uniref:ribonuclease H2 subunit C isoform X1 n=1 Tax=Parasteatoda tepidariorum TaxID=114398 RepID=UPI001C71B662|nr:ribonuclease H2 subunit C-like [Parasteatoda tepidariorum]